MVTLSQPEIKTQIINNKKYFLKHHYEPNDVVWWVDGERISGIVTHVEGDYCYIVDEYKNQYIKSQYDLFLDESNVIQVLLNDIHYMKKEIHNLNSNYNVLVKNLVTKYDNGQFNIEPPKISSRL